MASADLRQELDCSICLNIYTDPVTLRCGHNFCRVCIDRVLDSQEGSGGYSCPECRAESPERPALQRNITIHNIVGSLVSIQLDQEQPGTFCTYCIHSPVPAAKLCLLCEASLCDNHLRVHSNAPEHVLCDLTTSLQNRKCSVHKELFKYYCTEDATCICVSCSLAGEHRGHHVEMLHEASEKKKERLRNVLQTLTTKRQHTERRIQSLWERKREDKQEAADVRQRDTMKQLEDLKEEALNEVSRQEELSALTVMDLIQKLEIERDELSRKMCDIEELCNMTDPMTVLQEPDTGDVCDTENRGTRDEQVYGGDLDVSLITEALDTLSELIKGINTGIYEHKPTDLWLSEDSAGNKIYISHDMKTATWSLINLRHPETPQRFQCDQVMSTRGLSSGRHYLDVEVNKSMWWRVGLCYPSMDRVGGQSGMGDNNKFWCLCKEISKNQYSVRHDNEVIPLLDIIPFDKVRICLDYEGGQLSFYALCDPMRHLHTFNSTFTEPLHAALCLWTGYLKLSEGT